MPEIMLSTGALYIQECNIVAKDKNSSTSAFFGVFSPKSPN